MNLSNFKYNKVYIIEYRNIRHEIHCGNCKGTEQGREPGGDELAGVGQAVPDLSDANQDQGRLGAAGRRLLLQARGVRLGMVAGHG